MQSNMLLQSVLNKVGCKTLERAKSLERRSRNVHTMLAKKSWTK